MIHGLGVGTNMGMGTVMGMGLGMGHCCQIEAPPVASYRGLWRIMNMCDMTCVTSGETLSIVGNA